MKIVTSRDPVGAPIFYRDVPLAPFKNTDGMIRPLGDLAARTVTWRLRDISKPRSRLLLSEMPTCLNCHSFVADGKTLVLRLRVGLVLVLAASGIRHFSGLPFSLSAQFGCDNSTICLTLRSRNTTA